MLLKQQEIKLWKTLRFSVDPPHYTYDYEGVGLWVMKCKRFW